MTGPALGIPNVPTPDQPAGPATPFEPGTPLEPSTEDDGLLLEPLPGLEWSHAVELPTRGEQASAPADIRRAWIHHAPQARVLTLYRAVLATEPDAPAPWWLRALHHGRLASREAGFAVEDQVAALLAERDGWVYMPWAGSGEDGYWEFAPSDTTADGPAVPTTVLLTHRHGGWVDVVPAHHDGSALPVALAGVAELGARLEELESTVPN